MAHPFACYPPSVTRMIVLPAMRRSGANAAGATGTYQRHRAVEDLAADHVEHHVKFTNSFQLVSLQVHEGMHSQSEGGFTVRCPASANHNGSDIAGELHGDRTDTARGAVDQDGLACREVCVVDERLPCRQPGDRQGGGHGVADVGRKGSQVAGLRCVGIPKREHGVICIGQALYSRMGDA